MIDEILARVGFLRHRARGHVLEAEMTVEIGHGRHHGLAGQVDARRSFGDQHIRAPAGRDEAIALHNEGRVLDDVAVASDQRAPSYTVAPAD
jgi:hypothetical protein